MPELALTYAFEKYLAQRINGGFPDKARTFREVSVREGRLVDLVALPENGPRILIEVKQDCPLNAIATDGLKLYPEVRGGDIGILINIKEEWADDVDGSTDKRTGWLHKHFRDNGASDLTAEPMVGKFDFVSCGLHASKRATAAVICAWKLSVCER